MRDDFFYRLPPPTALLLLTTIFELTAAHVLQPLPRGTPPPTSTVPHQDLHVLSWPLLPTAAPLDPFDLQRRQSFNTICGYINGLSALPATCSAGSHCVLDSSHGVVGCCPDGQDTCTSGVFTSCVDANSGPQTVVNPYVFTCTGSSVCYKNLFDGGFSQYGCGTASDVAATVLASASGVTTTLDHPSTKISFTDKPSTLSEPTTLGTVVNTKPTSAGSSPSSIASSAEPNSEASSSTPPSPSPTIITLTPPPDSTSETSTSNSPSNSSDSVAPVVSTHPAARVGAIVGGTISGVAAIVAIVALALFFLRRRRGNTRSGPGPANITNGKYISAPKPGPGTGFTAVNQDSDAFETTMLPPVVPASPFSADLSAGGPSPFAYMGAAGAHNSYPPSEGYHYPGQYVAAYAGATHGGHSRLEQDQIPLTREIDDFSHGFHQALGRIGEEYEENARSGRGNGGDLSVNEGNGVHGAGGPGPEGGYPGSVRPLWQQNRRQSRNLMWM
ncbi:hypothetical protein B0T17DRAFT_605528 [Bombardia bombarda]|uniref:Uncharacterized protein n=1 Tax=Bombardia bombarda TaxID=252184 RepID=A0AA40CH23_9PEZI|nr:hypothetical protein B0T17DRAFT_605528 [Bombardia bombarda]